MRGAVNGEREQERVNDGEPLDIFFGVRSPALNAREHLRAFYAEDRGRELVHTEVPADLMVGIFWMRPMRAEASRPLITRFILKKQRPAIAERANVLRRKIREAAKIAGDGGALLLQDRKSTRLNSSHVRTSYAVFCSKNKRAATDSP